MPVIGERLYTIDVDLLHFCKKRIPSRASAVLNERSMAARVMIEGLHWYIRIPVKHFAASLISSPAEPRSLACSHRRVASLLQP